MPVSRKALAAALHEPFSDEVIKPVTKGTKVFSNVAPHHYIERLYVDAPLDYSVEVSPPLFCGDSVVSVLAKVTLHTTDGDRIYSGNGAEPLVGEEGQPLSKEEFGFAVKSAQSDALKIALKFAGMGLDLYNSEVKTVKAAPKRAPAPVDAEPEEDAPAPKPKAAAPKSAGWNGNLEIKFGKFKGMKFNDPGVDDSWIEWYLGVEHTDAQGASVDMFTKEKNRRIAAGTWNPESGRPRKSAPIKKRSIQEEDDF